MFVPFFVDGPLRGKSRPIPDTERHGHDTTVMVAPDYHGPIPYPEPAVVVRGEKPWEASKRIYRYRFREMTVLGRTFVIGWCAEQEPDEAALFAALINPAVRSAVALEDEFMALIAGQSNTTGGGK